MGLRLVATFGSFASMLGLIFAIGDIKSFNSLQRLLLIIGVFLFLWALILIFRGKPHIFKKDSQIRNYLYKWISHGGRVAIFSRDMTWVRDQSMKELLLSKARRKELCICLPEMIPLVQNLKNAGAEVFTYHELSHVPQSRFTIIHKGRMDAQVAIGRKIGKKFRIEEFSIGGHPVFPIANDLIEIITKFNQLKRKNN